MRLIERLRAFWRRWRAPWTPPPRERERIFYNVPIADIAQYEAKGWRIVRHYERALDKNPHTVCMEKMTRGSE